jgi:hypothetical protein
MFTHVPKVLRVILGRTDDCIRIADGIVAQERSCQSTGVHDFRIEKGAALAAEGATVDGKLNFSATSYAKLWLWQSLQSLPFLF